jgi:type VI secretion system protein ImpG
VTHPSPNFLRLYEEELRILRSAAEGFARDHPDVAKALGMPSVADPSVERVLEGVAFLAARVGLKIQASEEVLAREVIAALVPALGRPVPSLGIVEFQPELGVDRMSSPLQVGRFTNVHLSHSGTGERCVFRTCRPVRIDPIELREVAMVAGAGLLPLRARLPTALAGARTAIRFRFDVGQQARAQSMAIGDIDVYLRSDSPTASRVMKSLLVDGLGCAVLAEEKTVVGAGAFQARPVGFGDDESVLQQGPAAYAGHRLLIELMLQPELFQFIRLPVATALAGSSQLPPCGSFDVLMLLTREVSGLADDLARIDWTLRATPVLNQQDVMLDRMRWQSGRSEQPLIVDRTRAHAHEVLDVRKVTAFMDDGTQLDVPSIADPPPFSTAAGTRLFYSTARRFPAPWRVQAARGAAESRNDVSPQRPTEVHLAIVGPGGPVDAIGMSQVGVHATVCDGDRPALLWRSGAARSSVDAGGGLGVRWHVAPSRCVLSHLLASDAWQLVGCLRLSMDTLLDDRTHPLAERLRRLLEIFAVERQARSTRLVQAVRGASSRTSVRVIPSVPGPLAHARGVELRIEASADDLDSTPVFLLSMVLDRFLAGYASINSFTEVSVKTPANEGTWSFKPRRGAGELL